MKNYYIVAILFVLAGFMLFLHSANALPRLGDFGLREGDIVGAQSAGDPDIFIVNDFGYKRLFVSPQIFGLYGHLRYDATRSVSVSARDAFPTTGLFRNCETDSQQVWALEVIGEDTATLHAVNVSGEDAVRQDADFFRKVFCINSMEEALYAKSSLAYTNLSQVPSYNRVKPTRTPSP